MVIWLGPVGNDDRYNVVDYLKVSAWDDHGSGGGFGAKLIFPKNGRQSCGPVGPKDSI